jgi:hypothetical protein
MRRPARQAQRRIGALIGAGRRWRLSAVSLSSTCSTGGMRIKGRRPSSSSFSGWRDRSSKTLTEWAAFQVDPKKWAETRLGRPVRLPRHGARAIPACVRQPRARRQHRTRRQRLSTTAPIASNTTVQQWPKQCRRTRGRTTGPATPTRSALQPGTPQYAAAQKDLRASGARAWRVPATAGASISALLRPASAPIDADIWADAPERRRRQGRAPDCYPRCWGQGLLQGPRPVVR